MFIITSLLLSNKKDNTSDASIKVPLKVNILLFILLFISSIFIFPKGNLTPPGKIKVGIYSNGFFDLNKYENGSYGKESSTGAMFGMLPVYLRLLSHKVTVFDTISHIDDDKFNVLIFINLQQVFTEKEIIKIYDFIGNGGSMLVLGDHTNLQEIQKPLNTLISRTDIRYNFDSAIPLDKEWDWENQLDLMNFPVSKSFSISSNFGLSVGASLTIGAESYPFIISKYGFSDKGILNNKKGAYLGNMRYDKDERFSNIILASWTHYKKGKVMVFGDTSPFQNFSVLKNFYFIHNIIQFLNHFEGRLIYLSRLWVSLILFLIGIFILLKNGAIDRSPLLAITSAIIISFIIVQTKNSISNNSNNKSDPKNHKLCYIDNNHYNLIGTKPNDNSSIEGLYKNCIRNGFLPVYASWDLPLTPDPGNFLFIIAPQKSFSHNELESLSEFMTNGGNVVFSVGYEESEKSESFLKYFNFEIGDLPLGAAHTAKSINDKWELKMHKSWPVYDTNEKVTALCSAWDYPVITSREIGMGNLIIIGDSYFLLGNNLETKNNYQLGNILFLKDLLENNLENKN